MGFSISLPYALAIIAAIICRRAHSAPIPEEVICAVWPSPHTNPIINSEEIPAQSASMTIRGLRFLFQFATSGVVA